MSRLPLELTLHPRVPPRRILLGTSLGFDLQVPGGPLVEDADPLLAAIGARIVTITGEDEALTEDRFAPGRWLALRHEGIDGDGDPEVGIWDADGLRRASYLPYKYADPVLAAIDHDLEPRALVLREYLSPTEDRRTNVDLLLSCAALVSVDVSPAHDYRSPSRPQRKRLVLFTGGGSELRLWDPTAGNGPVEPDELPISVELVDELAALREATKLADAAAADDPLFGEWGRQEVETRTRRTWLRARAELGRRYNVGLLEPGMDRPAWSPDELDDRPVDEDDAISF